MIHYSIYKKEKDSNGSYLSIYLPILEILDYEELTHDNQK